jgi:hypothetical protein
MELKVSHAYLNNPVSIGGIGVVQDKTIGKKQHLIDELVYTPLGLIVRYRDRDGNSWESLIPANNVNVVHMKVEGE